MSDNEVSLRHYIETLFREYKEAHAREHRMMESSLDLANRNIEYRLAGLNEWRGQNKDERAALVNRDFFDSTVSGLRTSIWELGKVQTASKDDLSLRIVGVEKEQANLQGRSTQTVIVLGIVFTVLQIAMKFFL